MNPPSVIESSQGLLARLLELAPLDKFGLLVMTALFLLGVWRGLWWQVIRLVGLLLAVIAARFLAPEASTWILERSADISPRVAHGAAWGSIFLVALGAATLLGMLGQKMLEAMQLGLLNRMGGAVVGACTGLVVHLAVLVALAQLAPEDFVSKHVGNTYSGQLLDRAGSQWRVVLGAEAAARVDRLIGDHLPRPRATGAADHVPNNAPGGEGDRSRFTTKPPGVR